MSGHESDDLVALVGRAYAREVRRGGSDWSAFEKARSTLVAVDPESASPVRCFALIVEAAERFGELMYAPAEWGD